MAVNIRTNDLEEGLRVLAGSRGASGKNGYAIVHDGHRILVEYSTDSDDDILAVRLTCRYDEAATWRRSTKEPMPPPVRAIRPLAIQLSAEGGGHVRAKREGLAIEWQSGDAEFDDQVYVQSPTTDPVVLAAVLSPRVQAATCSLLDLGFESVSIDDDGKTDRERKVVARALTNAFVRGGDGSGYERARAAVESFIALAESLPPLITLPGSHPRPPLARLTSVLRVVGIVGWLFNYPLAAITYGGLSQLMGVPEHDVPTYVVVLALTVGLASGFFAAVRYGSLVAERARGRSDVLDLKVRASIAAFGSASVLATYAAMVVELITYHP